MASSDLAAHLSMPPHHCSSNGAASHTKFPADGDGGFEIRVPQILPGNNPFCILSCGDHARSASPCLSIGIFESGLFQINADNCSRIAACSLFCVGQAGDPSDDEIPAGDAGHEEALEGWDC